MDEKNFMDPTSGAPCPSKFLTDAVHFNTEEGLCSQVCLPQGLMKVAAKHGVEYGTTCFDHGFTNFVEAGVNAGVHYFDYSP